MHVGLWKFLANDIQKTKKETNVGFYINLQSMDCNGMNLIALGQGFCLWVDSKITDAGI
jgi:hypothetical protein